MTRIEDTMEGLVTAVQDLTAGYKKPQRQRTSYHGQKWSKPSVQHVKREAQQGQKRKQESCPYHPLSNTHDEEHCRYAKWVSKKRTQVVNDDKAANKAPAQQYDGLLHLPVHLGPFTTHALLDLGANISLVSSGFFTERFDPALLQSIESSTVTGISMENLNVMGSVRLPIIYDNELYLHTFLVVKEIVYDCVIGTDLSMKLPYYVDLEQMQVIPKRELLKPHSYSLSEAVHIPANTMKMLSCTLDSKFLHDYTGIFEPSLYLKRKGLHVANSLTNGDTQTSISVVNLTTSEIRLPRHTQMGIFNPLITQSSDNVEPPPCDITTIDEHLQQESYQRLNSTTREDLRQLLIEYSDIFVNPKAGNVYVTPYYEFDIDTGEHKPIHSKPYRVSPKEREIIAVEVEKMLSENVIQSSQSPWSFPVVLTQVRWIHSFLHRF
jgi:hypothetical protein